MNGDARALGRERARAPKRATVWAARILTAVPILMMSMSAVMKFARPPQVIEEFGGRFGYPESTLLAIGLLELACVVLYAIPQTAVLGAVLLTGYLGGAIATHVRIGDPGFVAPIVLALCAWGGLYLRDERLRPLLPIRRW